MITPLFRNGIAALAAAPALTALVTIARPAAAGPPGPPAARPVTISVEAESFQFPGDWETQPAGGFRGASNNMILFAGVSGARSPAVTAVELPRAGRYRLWVRSVDFPDDRPGTRRR